ncbi:MAG: DUF5717 family protein [bacterium]|nr:DUF5717 family protein [Clostridium sp.]MCM1536949.1 DUF5717 family protein [bacterium]
METVTQRLIDGKIEYDAGSLMLSDYKIELSIQKGETVKGSFQITSRGGNPVRGTVRSSLLRMQCLKTGFDGTQAEIPYRFSGVGMEEGDIQKGEFSIVSSAGEYTIPFVVTVAHSVLTSLLGPIRNLFHFANLAKTNWDEAVTLFYRDDFVSLFHGADRRYLDTYLGLSGTKGNQQNVDEFLVEINKKQPIEYLPMETHIRMEEPEDTAQGRITITRNGWGYTALAIETDGDFLSVEKKVLTDDDFLGNICNTGFLVDSAGLHAGNNFGVVRLFNASVDIRIEIQVTAAARRGVIFSGKKEMRRLTVSLMEYYAGFRTKKLSSNVWLRESKKIVERMNELEERSIPARLFKAQLLITEERTNEAKWILERVEQDLTYGKRAPEHWCYYLYLTSLVRRSEVYVDEVTIEVEQIYAQHPENWRIAWLLLYLREEFSKSPYKKWLFLENQFHENCKSPVLYMEALALLNANPTMLSKLSEFEIQVLNYAAKKDVLKKDVILQLQNLAPKIRQYSERMFFILQKSYRTTKDDETLQILLSFLIKGGKFGERYFSWYALGIERELRVTRLYESYMLSLPKDFEGTLPKMVMMYFAYHSELDYQGKSVLYANIYRNRDKYPEIAVTYRQSVERFLVEQIGMGHINKQLAYLYSELVTPAMLNEENAPQFITLLFSHLITVKEDACRQVVLIYDRLKGEHVYPVTDKKAVVPIYDSSYQILLQDEHGNRRVSGELYRIEKLMIPGRFIKEAGGLVKSHLGMDLYLCEGGRSGVVVTDKNVECYRRLWASGYVKDEFKREIRLRLAQFLYDNDRIEECDAVLLAVDPEDMGTRERSAFLRLLILRAMYDKAYQWLCAFGMEQVDAAVAVRLISRLIVRGEFKRDEKLILLAFRTFEGGKYDENILRYLAAYYEGTTKHLRDLWKAAKDFELDVNHLCERILLQILFSGYYIGEKNELFYSYVKSGAGRQVELAYLTVSAYDYFVRGNVVDEKLFSYFTRLFYRGEELHDVCRLAYLKFYADSASSAGEEVLQLAGRFLEYFMSRGICFPFFADYAQVVKCAARCADETMIEYRTVPGRRVLLHYVMQTEDGDGAYVTEPMTDMYEGIHIKSFVLFFGETLQYYITEETAEGEQLTESATISKNDMSAGGGGTRYEEINDLVIAGTLQDYSGFHKMYAAYGEKSFLTAKLFSPQAQE